MEELQELIAERWMDIVGWERLYQISDNGRIKRLSRIVKVKRSNSCEYTMQFKEKMLTPNTTQWGYKKINLISGNRIESYFLHRLVANAFIPNYNKKPFINHIDNNKENNHYSNLEWVTTKENIAHAYETGIRRPGERNGRARLNEFQVRVIRKCDVGSTILSRFFGVHKSTIESIKSGRNWKHLLTAPSPEIKL